MTRLDGLLSIHADRSNQALGPIQAGRLLLTLSPRACSSSLTDMTMRWPNGGSRGGAFRVIPLEMHLPSSTVARRALPKPVNGNVEERVRKQSTTEMLCAEWDYAGFKLFIPAIKNADLLYDVFGCRMTWIELAKKYCKIFKKYNIII